MNHTIPRRPNSYVSTLLVAAIASIALFTTVGCRYSPEQKAEKAVSYVSSKLDFSDAQQAEFKKMADEAVVDYRSMTSGRKVMAAEVEKLLVTEKADTAELKKLVAANDVKRQELTAKWIDRMADFHSRLTPPQKQKALKLMQKFRDRIEERSQ